MRCLIIGAIAALAIGLGTAPAASADGYCTTSVQNHGEDTYTYCRYDGGRSTTIICYGNQYGRCTIEEN
jgi:hypothetical protein